MEKTYEDDRFDYGTGSSVYTARMLVFCMYKGPRGTVPMRINVTEAGQFPRIVSPLNQLALMVSKYCFFPNFKGSKYFNLWKRPCFWASYCLSLVTNICIIIYEYGLLVSAKKTICDAKSTATGYMEKNLVKNSHFTPNVHHMSRWCMRRAVWDFLFISDSITSK